MALLSPTVHESRNHAPSDRDARLREVIGLCARVARDLLLIAALVAGFWWTLSTALT